MSGMRTRSDVDELSQEQIEAYLKKSAHCPFCGSGDIDGEHIEIDAGSAYQDISCNECHKEWTDSYTLTGVI